MNTPNVQMLADLKQIDRDCRNEIDKVTNMEEVATYWGVDVSSTNQQTLHSLHYLFIEDAEQTVAAKSPSFAVIATCVASFLSDHKQFIKNNDITAEIACIKQAISKNDSTGRPLDELTNFDIGHAYDDRMFDAYYEEAGITNSDFKTHLRRLFHYVGMISFLSSDEIFAHKFGVMLWFIAEHHTDVKKLKLIV